MILPHPFHIFYSTIQKIDYKKMRITSIVENTSLRGLPVEHGLSLFIELDNGQNILFDMGQGSLFAENAERLGLHISDVDTAVISHGHYDHGGGLSTFLMLNKKARVYIHEKAFEPHYSLRENRLRFIGLDDHLVGNERIVHCASVTRISDGITLFANVLGDCCNPHGNSLLFSPDKVTNDDFCHEQSLIIEHGDNVILIAGCAHRGIVNIMNRAIELTGKTPTHVFGGMHLVKSGLSEVDERLFISSLADRLLTFSSTRFYTMHCTGTEQYLSLKAFMNLQSTNRITYMACGETVNI